MGGYMAALLGRAALAIGKKVLPKVAEKCAGQAAGKGFQAFSKKAGEGAFKAGGDVLKAGGKDVLKAGGKGAIDLLGKSFKEFMAKGGKEALEAGKKAFSEHGGLKNLGASITKHMMKSAFGMSSDKVGSMGGSLFAKMFKSTSNKPSESSLKPTSSAL